MGGVSRLFGREAISAHDIDFRGVVVDVVHEAGAKGIAIGVGDIINGAAGGEAGGEAGVEAMGFSLHSSGAHVFGFFACFPTCMLMELGVAVELGRETSNEWPCCLRLAKSASCFTNRAPCRYFFNFRL